MPPKIDDPATIAAEVKASLAERDRKVDELCVQLETERKAREENNARLKAMEDAMRDRKVFLKNDQPEKERISMSRLISCLKNPELLREEGFELERDVLSEGRKRDLSFGTDTAGGHLVPEQYLPERFIEMLRAKVVVTQLGATMLDGLVSSPVPITRQTSGSTHTWIGEAGLIGESQPAFDQVIMTPKKLSNICVMSYELTRMSNPSIEGVVQRDLAASAARAIDDAALHGGGANEPDGVTQQTGINLQSHNAVATLALLWQNVLRIEEDNADLNESTLGWAMHPTMWNVIRQLLQNVLQNRDIQGGVMKLLHGFKVATTTQIPTNLGVGTDETEIFFADWSQMFIGRWEGIRFDVSTEGDDYFKNDLIGVRMIQRLDIAVRHPESFCYTVDGRIS